MTDALNATEPLEAPPNKWLSRAIAAEGLFQTRAQAVRYVPKRDAIEIVTNHSAGSLTPLQWIGVLQDVPSEELQVNDIFDRTSGKCHLPFFSELVGRGRFRLFRQFLFG